MERGRRGRLETGTRAAWRGTFFWLFTAAHSSGELRTNFTNPTYLGVFFTHVSKVSQKATWQTKPENTFNLWPRHFISVFILGSPNTQRFTAFFLVITEHKNKHKHVMAYAHKAVLWSITNKGRLYS